MKPVDNVPLIDLVLVGGGHAHALVIRQLAMRPQPGLRVTLISKTVMTPYSGMLPGFIAGHFSYDDCHIDLRKLCEFAGVAFIQSEVRQIHPQSKTISLSDRPDFHFDLLSINIGSTPHHFQIQAVAKHCLAVKPIEKFIPRLEQLFRQPQQKITIIGGGASGVELVLAIQYRLQKTFPHKKFFFHILFADQKILSSHNPATQKKITGILENRHIKIIASASVVDVKTQAETKIIHYNQHGQIRQLSTDAIIWATSASAPQWLEQSGIKLDDKGFIEVNTFLQSTSHPFIFAAGDIATIRGFCYPKSGVYAVRQGKPLYHNLIAWIKKQQLRAYRPQRHFLSLLNCGNQYAIASKYGFAVEGKWLWFYKRWIDVRFMKMLKQLPAMTNHHSLKQLKKQYANLASRQQLSKIAEIPMHCGGCGAKVSPSVLHDVLQALLKADNSDFDKNIVLSIRDQDDAAAFSVPQHQLLVQSIDYFRSFLDDPFLFGRIAVNHALGDLYAMGAKPHSVLANISLPYMPANLQYQTLYQLMSGILKQLSYHHCILLGGHSSEGKELACGFSVNGMSENRLLITKSALRTDMALILTKPLGTGVIMAANMRYQADGVWVSEAIEQMLLSHQEVLPLLLEYNITACTDITGFGLLGHLYEMLKASTGEIQAVLKLSSIPFLRGAQECTGSGIYSSLYPENLYFSRYVQDFDPLLQQFPETIPLLFDPQTAGGLLIAVDKDQSTQMLEKIQNLGYTNAAIIGHTCSRLHLNQKPISLEAE